MHSKNLEEAKASYIRTDYTGLDKTGTIYYDLEHTTELLEFVISTSVEIAKSMSVSLTFNVTCSTQFLGNYTSSIKDISSALAVAETNSEATSSDESIVPTICSTNSRNNDLKSLILIH